MFTKRKITRRIALSAALLAIFVLAGASTAAAADSPLGAAAVPMPKSQGTNWNLIFTEGFNEPELNPSIWSPFRPGGPQINNPYNVAIESAMYDPANVSVRDGSAVLQVTRGHGSRFPYRSGVLQSAQRFNFTYGYIEARVKVSACHGCWPAFWLLEDTIDPYELSNTEVDVFEFFSTKRTRQPFFNFHWNKFGAELNAIKYGKPKHDYTRGFHTYGLHWQPGRMQVFVDGRPGPTMTGPLVTDVPMYPIFNLAIFRGGRPGNNAKMAIDYVRAWQRP